MANLVMAAVSGYGPPVFERFLKSLRNTGYSEDIVLFVEEKDLTPPIHEICNNHRAHVLTYPNAPYVIHTYRFRMYEAFLKENRANYESGKILVADSRDVFFQSNPFDYNFPSNAELYLAQEVKLISREVYNTRWVVSYFGDAVYQQICENHILCSGTTMGTCEAMLYYFDRLNLTSLILTEQRLPNAVYEQGVLNYLYYTGKLIEAKPLPLPNSSGLFLTMGGDKKIITDEGVVTNREGVASSIVHQFDRMSLEQLQLLQRSVDFPLDDIIEKKSKG